MTRITPQTGTDWRTALGIVLCCCLVWGSPRAEIRAQDDTGRPVVLEHPARRVVSLAPHITELLFAAGAGDAVVGVSEHSDYPEAARSIARVGGGSGLDLEAILALRPDLVIAWGSGSPPGQLQQLRRLGLPVFVSEPGRVPDIPGSLQRFGRLTGHEDAAIAAARRFTAAYLELRERYAGGSPVRVFFQIWPQPLMTVNGAHIITDVAGLCGGINVFEDLPALAPQVSLEAVLQRDPEVIVAAGDDPQGTALVAQWRRWGDLAAVRGGNLHTVQRELLVRHTPRLLEGAAQLCELLESVRKKRATK